MIELDITDFKSYLKQTLEVCLHVMKSESDNDYYIDTGNNIGLVNDNINNFINGLLSKGKGFDSIADYITEYCAVNSVRNVLSFSLSEVIGAMNDFGGDLYLFTEQSINAYLNKLQSYNIVKLSEILSFPEGRSKDKQKIVSYLNLWHFCKIKNNDFKDFILEQVFDLSKEFRKDSVKSDFEKLLITQ